MPSKTPKQARLMAAVAHGWKPGRFKGPPLAVAQEFNQADKGTGILSRHAAGGMVKPPTEVFKPPVLGHVQSPLGQAIQNRGNAGRYGGGMGLAPARPPRIPVPGMLRNIDQGLKSPKARLLALGGSLNQPIPQPDQPNPTGLDPRVQQVVMTALQHLRGMDASSAAAVLSSSPEAMANPELAAVAQALRTSTGVNQATQTLGQLGSQGQSGGSSQGFAKGGTVDKETRVRPIQDLPRDKNGLFIQPDTLTDEIAVWVEHNRMRASKKYFYADTHCGDPKTVDPKKKYNCGSCNQADGKVCLLVEDDSKKKGQDGRYPPLVIDREKGSCGPYEIIDADDPEQRGNRLPKSVANYGVRKGGGPDEVFGCWQCWKGIKSKWTVLLGRGLWCGEHGTTVEDGACCTVNGAPVEE